MADTGDTLTDIHASVGELLNGAEPEVEFDDDALDAELEAKADGEPTSEPETPEPEPVAAAPEPEVPEPDDDPLATAKPFTYTVDGAEKAFPGGQFVYAKDGSPSGAIFAADQIKDLQYKLQRADYLENQNQTLYQKTRDYDAVTVTDRATNAEHKGMDAVEHLVVENARQHAALQLMAETLENPDKLIALALAVQSGDQTPLQQMTDRLRLMAENATYRTKAQFSQRLTQAKDAASQVEDRATVTPQAISGAVEQWAQQYPSLTTADKQHAIQHLSKIGATIVRPATPDEAATAGVKPGQLIIDHPVVVAYLSDRAAWREEQARSTTAVSTAAKENAARLAAAQRGTRRATTPTRAKPRETVPAATEETWAQQRARMMNGEFAASDDE